MIIQKQKFKTHRNGVFWISVFFDFLKVFFSLIKKKEENINCDKSSDTTFKIKKKKHLIVLNFVFDSPLSWISISVLFLQSYMNLGNMLYATW